MAMLYVFVYCPIKKGSITCLFLIKNTMPRLLLRMDFIISLGF